jgi:hypothetical protein
MTAPTPAPIVIATNGRGVAVTKAAMAEARRQGVVVASGGRNRHSAGSRSKIWVMNPDIAVSQTGFVSSSEIQGLSPHSHSNM